MLTLSGAGAGPGQIRELGTHSRSGAGVAGTRSAELEPVVYQAVHQQEAGIRAESALKPTHSLWVADLPVGLLTTRPDAYP